MTISNWPKLLHSKDYHMLLALLQETDPDIVFEQSPRETRQLLSNLKAIAVNMAITLADQQSPPVDIQGG